MYATMDVTSQSEKLDEMLACVPPERRAEVKQLAAELEKNKDVQAAAELLNKSRSLGPALDDAKFSGELGWLTALAAAIAIIAI